MITTHVLDTARGCPAARLPVDLDFFITGQGWMLIGRSATDAGGRIHDFGESAAPGLYRLVFDVVSYMPASFFPSVTVTFDIRNPAERYHIPLLLSPFGYSTYRGS